MAVAYCTQVMPLSGQFSATLSQLYNTALLSMYCTLYSTVLLYMYCTILQTCLKHCTAPSVQYCTALHCLVLCPGMLPAADYWVLRMHRRMSALQ